MRSWRGPLVLLVLCVALTACAPRRASPLAHLLAPCCWRETLDVHASPLADQLRAEVRRREAAGESPEAIESALVARYGPRLRTHVPESLGTALAILVGLCGAAALARFARRPQTPAPPISARPLAPGDLTPYEAALEADLRD